MGLLVVLLVALAACAVLFGPLILPGVLLAAVVFGLVRVASHLRGRPVGLARSETAGRPDRSRWLAVRAAVQERAAAASPPGGARRAVGPAIAEAATEPSIGLDLVRALRDAVMPAVGSDELATQGVCPILGGLAEGSPLAARVRCGHDRKAELLHTFEALSSEVAPHNLYPVAGSQAEEVIEALSTSLRAGQPGERADCDLCGRVLEGLAGWRQAHFGPSPADSSLRSPRQELVKVLKAQAYDEPQSVGRVLEAFDDAVASFLAGVESASSAAELEFAGRRLLTAIAIHDSVESGVLGPILKRVPGGRPLAARLHEGFAYHALLQRSWDEITNESGGPGGEEGGENHAEQVLAALASSFLAHRQEEMTEVAGFLDGLPAGAFRTVRSPLDDVMWPWHSGGATLLAIRMALWADSAPSRVHALTAKHPSSRALRSFTHLADTVQDHRSRGSARPVAAMPSEMGPRTRRDPLALE